MLPSHLKVPSDHTIDSPKRRNSNVGLFLRRVSQDPSLLRQYKPHLGGGALALLLLFLLLRPSSNHSNGSAVRWTEKAADNWADYVGLGLARAKVLESTPPGYVDIGDRWIGGGGALYATRPRVGSPAAAPPPPTVVSDDAAKSSSLLHDPSFDRDRHGVLGGASTEWSSGVVGMGTWLGERVDMRKESARDADDALAKLESREALVAHILKRGWEYLDAEDEANTKKLIAGAEADGTMHTLPLRDRVRSDPELRQEAAVGWGRVFGTMEGEWLKSALEVAVEKLVRRSPIVVFSKTTCTYSQRAKDLLRKYHLSPEPHIVEVDLRPDGVNLKGLLTRKTGHSTFPNIIIGSRSIGGWDDLELLERDNTAFLALLKEAGITVHRGP
ncbi:hypothetical protein RQP46_003646 [Phenoliferia psychrophenolica]